MIFHRIVVRNLFTYQGEVTYDFVPRDGEGNVALVVGRNGYGKTSLLNSVKLLFLGSDDRGQRQVGFPPRNLSRRDYVLGTSAWKGILNQAAKTSGESECSVRVELGEADAVTFIAERSWKIEQGNFSEELYVASDGREYRREPAEERLSEILPRGLVPFFFFDGEELQFLAEASDSSRAEAMERLLGLDYIGGVEDQLRDLIKDWRREALPADIQVQITQVEGDIATLAATIVAERQKAEDLRRDADDASDRADALSRRMKAMRGSGSLALSGRLDDDIEGLEADLEGSLNDLAYSVATDAPLLGNPGLIHAAQKPLNDLVERKAKSAESVFEHVFKVLPERLFAEPPHPKERLDNERQRFYSNKLRRILDAYALEDEGEPPLLSSLDLPRARRLQERFLGYSASLSVLRQDRARRLKEVSRKRQQLDELKAERREAEFGSSERAEEYRRLEDQYGELQRGLGKIEGDLEQQKGRLQELDRKKTDAESKKASLEKRHYSAARAGRRLEIAVQVRDSFVSYRAKSRDMRRSQIEDAINKHFRCLMTGHQLVDRIKIDEDFFMHFVDASGEEVGHLTISHGMRQLAVTALLWALKDVSGRSLPVIVDTPLARIDRENQRNLLEHYYPNAAEQVIILATNSEIDEPKFELLRPHLGAHFKLDNPGGQATRVERKELAHG